MLIAGFALVAGALSLGTNIYKKVHTRQKLREFLAPEPLPAVAESVSQKAAMLSQALATTAPHALRDAPASPGMLGEPTFVNPDHYLAAGVMAMGLSTAGILFFPPLRLLSVPVLLYTAVPLLRASYQALRYERRFKAVMLDSLAMLGALAAHYFFLSGLECCIYFTGQKLLHKTKDNSRQHLRTILGSMPRSVWVLRHGVEEQLPYEALSVGDVLVVRSGETVPADGQITVGIASVDQRMLTGEAQPVEKGPGDTIFAATVVLSGCLYIQVHQAGADTVAAHIEDILLHTADFQGVRQTRMEGMADQAVLPTLGLSALALSRLGRVGAVTVLNANYFDAARLASPLSMLNFLTLAAQRGILIKDGRALEMLNKVDTVVFDKTGTLTLEQPHIGAIYPYNGLQPEDVLRYAAAAEAHHTHPIARAIQEAAATRGLTLPSIEDARYEMGYGIKVDIDGHCVRVGSARFLALEGMTLSSELQEVQQANHVQGHSLVFVAIDDQVGGALSLHATLRPEARRILRQLRRRHLQLYIISGDHHQPTTQLAATLGIDHVFAETLPDEKATLIARLQQEGKTVCFVGDGINDAMALKQADVSVSLRGASTVATDTAQLLLMDQSLNQLGHLFEVAEQFNTNMKINMAAALVPGFLCIGGVFILHLGLFSASMLYNLSIVTGLGNAMRPRLRSAWDQRQEHQQPSSGTLSALLTSGA